MEEVSIKELIRILYRHRFLMIALIISSLTLSLVYSFFMVVPMYQTKVEVEIIDIDTGIIAFDEDNDPEATTDALLVLMKGPQFADQVSKVLEGGNIKINNADIRTIISSSKGADRKSIKISARYKGKEEVAQIANAAAGALKICSSNYLKGRVQQQLAIIEDQIELGRENVEAALSKYKESTATQGTEKLKSEINVDESLSVLLSDENLIDKLYNDDLLPLIKVYDSLKVEYSRLKLVDTYLSNNSNINILSNAVEPENPSTPDRKGIIVLSLIAGICISVLTAFTIEYLKNEK